VLFGESFGGSYLVRVAREGDELVLRWQEPNVRGIADDWEQSERRVLVERLEEFDLSYRRDFAAAWTDQFERNLVPKLLRMQIKADGRYWPDLILRVGQNQ
jgi:general secretion pathway protein J